jgi:hypothetical protein
MKRASKPEAQAVRKTFSWLQLYEARYIRTPPTPLPSGSPGRPARAVPVKKTSVTYTAGDEEALLLWQEKFTDLLGRKPSMGETAGLLARICTDRLEWLHPASLPGSLGEFVTLMVEEAPEADAESKGQAAGGE